MIHRRIKAFHQYFISENINIDSILDKINRGGHQSLTYDERTYLNQYSNSNINKDLENWLFSYDEETFDLNGKKLLFDEFDEDEDIFYNTEKLKRVISKILNSAPFTNNADWGGGYVWRIDDSSHFTGTFLYLSDDELLLIKRSLVDDIYDDIILKNISNSRELYLFFLELKAKNLDGKK